MAASTPINNNYFTKWNEISLEVPLKGKTKCVGKDIHNFETFYGEMLSSKWSKKFQKRCLMIKEGKRYLKQTPLFYIKCQFKKKM